MIELINKCEIKNIEAFMHNENCISMTSTKYRQDLTYFLANHMDEGDYVCEVGPYKGGLTCILAYVCKQLGKKLIICEAVQEYADIVQKNLIALGYADIVQIHVMSFVEFVAQELIPENTLLTIIDANHYYECALENFIPFETLKKRSYAVAFHDFGLKDTNDRMGVGRAVKKTFLGKNIYYIGDNTSFLPCELHTTPATDNTFFEGSEGALIILREEMHREQKVEEQMKKINFYKEIQNVIKSMLHTVVKKYKKTPLSHDAIKFAENISLIQGKHGKFFVMDHDTGVGRAIRESGVWGEGHVSLFSRLVKKGDTVLDIGANIGHHSVCFANMTGSRGRVFAFEPQLPVYQILCANAMINGATNIYPVRAVVGEEAGIVSLPVLNYEMEENFGAMCIENKISSGMQNVIKVSVDEFVANTGNSVLGINFIKIDVQTFELFVLQGAVKTLTVHKPLLFIEISPYWMKKINNYDYRAIYSFLQKLGYVFFSPELEATPEIPQYPLDETSSHIEWDILAAHKDSLFVKEMATVNSKEAGAHGANKE